MEILGTIVRLILKIECIIVINKKVFSFLSCSF